MALHFNYSKGYQQRSRLLTTLLLFQCLPYLISKYVMKCTRVYSTAWFNERSLQMCLHQAANVFTQGSKRICMNNKQVYTNMIASYASFEPVPCHGYTCTCTCKNMHMTVHAHLKTCINQPSRTHVQN